MTQNYYLQLMTAYIFPLCHYTGTVWWDSEIDFASCLGSPISFPFASSTFFSLSQLVCLPLSLASSVHVVEPIKKHSWTNKIGVAAYKPCHPEETVLRVCERNEEGPESRTEDQLRKRERILARHVMEVQIASLRVLLLQTMEGELQWAPCQNSVFREFHAFPCPNAK